MCASAPGCAPAGWQDRAFVARGTRADELRRFVRFSTRSGTSPSFPAELRRPARVVRRQTFLRVLSLEQPLLQLALQRKTLLEADLQSGRDSPLDESDRARGLRR